MSEQIMVDEKSRFQQLIADLKIPSGEVPGVPQQLADAVAQAGLEAAMGLELAKAALLTWLHLYARRPVRPEHDRVPSADVKGRAVSKHRLPYRCRQGVVLKTRAPGDTTKVRAADQVEGNESMIIQPERPAFSAACLDGGGIATVNLRPVPPVTLLADVCRWSAGTGVIAGIASVGTRSALAIRTVASAPPLLCGSAGTQVRIVIA